MAANPQHANGRNTPRLTMPLAPHSPLMHQPRHQHTLRADTRFATWEPCERCKQSGLVDQARPRCAACGRTFSADELSASARHNWRGRLPCGDPIDAQGMEYVSAECPDCEGIGYTAGYVTLGDVIDFMAEAYEAQIEAVTTARMRRVMP